MNKEIIGCPTCGEAPDISQIETNCWRVFHDAGFGDHIICAYGKTKQEAIDKWNTRFSKPKTEISEETKEIIKETIKKSWASWAMFEEKIHDDIFIEQLSAHAAKNVVSHFTAPRVKFLEELNNFVTDHRKMFTNKEWIAVRMCWFKMEEKYNDLVESMNKGGKCGEVKDEM